MTVFKGGCKRKPRAAVKRRRFCRNSCYWKCTVSHHYITAPSYGRRAYSNIWSLLCVMVMPSIIQAIWRSNMGFRCQFNVRAAISVSHAAWDEVTVCWMAFVRRQLQSVFLGFTVMIGTDAVSRSSHSAVRNLTNKAWTSCQDCSGWALAVEIW